jgi:formiminotetrahydrofolate cyclodeaminase
LDAPRSTQPLTDYLDAVASGEPTPGGGSVVAVVAALAAALGEMVCRLTLGRPAYAAAEPEIKPVLSELARARARLLSLAAADEAAYRRYLAAIALPKTTDAERSARRPAVRAALLEAIDIPLAVASECAAIGARLEPVARLGNRHALSDAAAAALLVDAALRGALLNVRGNVTLLRDPDAAARYLERVTSLETDGRAATDVILRTVQAREAG